MECVRKKPQIDEKEARESELIEKERRIHEVEEKCTTVRLETGLIQTVYIRLSCSKFRSKDG